MNSRQELLDFLYEYAGFFSEMEQTETQKLDNLLSRQLERIEHSISMQQAMDKRLQNLEKRRADLQTKLGFDGMSFKNIIEEFPEENRAELSRLFERIENSLDNIKFLNQKSMNVAKSRLEEMGSNAQFKVSANLSNYSGYTTKDSNQMPAHSILETKV
ncbi:flagellar export chaperone FlgN [Hydrogenoanaerobacterium sp.]|uniref:flagellar export chaperone FlgN n=1 Tax=Hydrogenoanaerobacterium sp. TaxID=2953763 RepID=UPI0028A2ACB8|nr:flagellar export chaperone FlgN [Hydrogenoanaerobacterium sp.]